MKYKVLKEMPFAKVGNILEGEIHNFSFTKEYLVEQGWLAPLPEKQSLAVKMSYYIYSHEDGFESHLSFGLAKIYSEMAYSHIIPEVLEAFDKEYNRILVNERKDWCMADIMDLRRAIEGVKCERS